MGKVDPAPMSPVPEDDDLGPVPGVKPRLAVHGAELGELLARTFLRLLARRDARVHEDVAVASYEGGKRPQPAKPFLEGGSQLPAHLVEGRRRAALEQRHLVVANDDTLVEGTGSGLMCEERLAWLASRLAEAPIRPTMIFMHHAPFLTGIAHMDRLGLEGAEAMGAIIERHPQVERVVCGHLHRPIQVRWHGTVAMTSPSTAHQVMLGLEKHAPLSFVMEPPAFLLHVWTQETGLLSHTSYIGEFPGPYPFHEGGRLIQ